MARLNVGEEPGIFERLVEEMIRAAFGRLHGRSKVPSPVSTMTSVSGQFF